MLWVEDGSVGLKQRNLFDSDKAFQGNISSYCSTAGFEEPTMIPDSHATVM